MSVYSNYDRWWRDSEREPEPRVNFYTQEDMRANSTPECIARETDRRRDELSSLYFELTRNEAVEEQFTFSNNQERDGSSFYFELALSGRIVNNIQKYTNLTYNQLSSFARRKIERKIDSFYGSNSESIVAKIEAMRLLLLVIADTRSFFNSTDYNENLYITPNSWPGYISGLKALSFLEVICQFLARAVIRYGNSISAVLDAEIYYLTEELENARDEVKDKLYAIEEAKLAFVSINSNDNELLTAPEGFYDRDKDLTWIEQRIAPALNANVLTGTNHYDTFHLFGSTASINDAALLPITEWEVLNSADNRSRGLGLRVNGRTLRSISALSFDSEPGGVIRLSIEALIVPGQSTLSFSSQLSDNIQATEGNALSVDSDRAQREPNERFIDL